MTSNTNKITKLAYSRQETAKVLGVSVVTIHRLTKKGLLRPSRALRTPLYPKTEIERFLRETSQVKETV